MHPKKKKKLQSPTTPTISCGAIRVRHPHHEFIFLQVEEEVTKEVEEMDGDDDNEEDPLDFPFKKPISTFK